MAKLTVKTGSTSRLEHVFILDSTSTTGAGKTGLTNASVTMYFFRPADIVATSVTLSAGTLGTWTTGGFKEVDATNMPGVYEIGMPNAVFAATFNHSVVMIKGTGIAPLVLEYNLVSYDPLDTVRLGLTALPNVVQGNVGAISTGNASGQVTVATNNDKSNYSLTVTPPTALEIWHVPASSVVTAATIGLQLKTNIDAAVTSRMASFTYTAPPTVTQIWQTDVSGFSTVGQAGTYLKNGMPTFTYTAPPTVTQIWQTDVSGFSTVGQAGTYLKTAMPTFTYTTPPTAIANADALLGRNIAGGSDGGRTVKDAFRVLRNKVSISGATLTVTTEDDATTAWTATLTTDAAATPVTGIDPAGP